MLRRCDAGAPRKLICVAGFASNVPGSGEITTLGAAVTVRTGDPAIVGTAQKSTATETRAAAAVTRTGRRVGTLGTVKRLGAVRCHERRTWDRCWRPGQKTRHDTSPREPLRHAPGHARASAPWRDAGRVQPPLLHVSGHYSKPFGVPEGGASAVRPPASQQTPTAPLRRSPPTLPQRLASWSRRISGGERSRRRSCPWSGRRRGPCASERSMPRSRNIWG